jgi:hypothetical protein
MADYEFIKMKWLMPSQERMGQQMSIAMPRTKSRVVALLSPRLTVAPLAVLSFFMCWQLGFAQNAFSPPADTMQPMPSSA